MGLNYLIIKTNHGIARMTHYRCQTCETEIAATAISDKRYYYNDFN
jgi:hypothetical protein